MVRMKNKLFAVITVLVALCTLMTVVCAVDVTEEQELIYLDDGSYIVITVEEISVRALNTKTGRKTYAYNSGDEIVWSAILTGTFTYDGASSVCTAASCKTIISDNAWFEVSKSAEPDKNAAIADVTMGKKIAGIKVSEVSIDMKLTCDKNGNLS